MAFKCFYLFLCRLVYQWRIVPALFQPAMSDESCPPPAAPKQSTIMSLQEAATGKKSHWAELEITGWFPHCK